MDQTTNLNRKKHAPRVWHESMLKRRQKRANEEGLKAVVFSIDVLQEELKSGPVSVSKLVYDGQAYSLKKSRESIQTMGHDSYEPLDSELMEYQSDIQSCWAYDGLLAEDLERLRYFTTRVLQLPASYVYDVAEALMDGRWADADKIIAAIKSAARWRYKKSRNDFIRRNDNHTALEEERLADPWTPSVEELAGRREVWSWFQKVNLPPKLKELLLCYAEGRSFDEAGKSMGLTVQEIAKHRKSLTRLQNKLNPSQP
jgi:DNA-directed RNA polymerase specialized sigma24 family protein